MPSIHSLAATRRGLLAATCGTLPEDAMNALVGQLSEVEDRIVAAPCLTYAELAIKAALLAEKLSDESSYDPLVACIIEQLLIDLTKVERETERQETHAARHRTMAA